MNIQALMKQAQSLQKDMMKAKEEIDNTLFTGSNSFVTVKVNGKKKVLDIKIDTDSVDKTVEMLEDLITQAINEANKKASSVFENKMKGLTGGINIPGLF